MMARMMLIDLGVLVVGIVMLAVGWLLTPGPSSFVFPGPINETGQSLIALGLTFIIIAIGLLLAGFQERMMAMMKEMSGH